MDDITETHPEVILARQPREWLDPTDLGDALTGLRYNNRLQPEPFAKELDPKPDLS